MGRQAPALTIASPRKVVRSARWMNSLVEGDSLKVSMREEAMQAGCAPECTLKLDRTVMLVQAVERCSYNSEIRNALVRGALPFLRDIRNR